MCKWKLYDNENVILTSENINVDNKAKLSCLLGQNFKKITVSEKNVHIFLSNNISFHLYETADEGEDYFIFYNKNLFTISYSSSGGVCLENI